MRNFRNVRNLEKVAFDICVDEHVKNFTEFLIRQDNLKHLDMKMHYDAIIIPFPHRDISTEVKFQLKTLKLSCYLIEHENFYKFFQTQAENLEELSLYSYNEEIVEILFTK